MTDTAYIEQLRLSPMRPPGRLPRASAHLVELVQTVGVVEPVVVRSASAGSYEILANAETWMAAQQARLDRVPVHVLDDISDEEAAEIVLAAEVGFTADPIDEAEYLQGQLEQIEQGGSRYRAVTKLAYRTGYSRTHISHAIRLLKLPIAIQEMVRSKQLSVGHAEALVSVELRSAQLAIAKKIRHERLSVRQTRALVRDLRGSNVASANSEPTSNSRKSDPNTLRLEKQISERVGCDVQLNSDEARLTINYHNLDILDGVLEKLGIL